MINTVKRFLKIYKACVRWQYTTVFEVFSWRNDVRCHKTWTLPHRCQPTGSSWIVRRQNWYDRNHWSTIPRRPNCRSRRSVSRSWSTVSNAAVKSSKHSADTCPLSAASNKSLYIFVTAVSVLKNWRYADCVVGVTLLLSRKDWNRVCTIFSKSLERNDRFDTGL